MTDRTVVLTQHLSVDPEAVFRAAASPYGLSAWCCDDARVESFPGGRIVLRWSDGRQAAGRWTDYDPPYHLAFRVVDDEGGVLEADLRMTPGVGGTALTGSIRVPEHMGDLEDAAIVWRQRLADLGVYAEEGVHARSARRPMLGIWGDQEHEEDGRGALVGGLVEGGGAEKAGLRKGDRIVGMGAGSVATWRDLGGALDRHAAGDTIEVGITRDGQNRTLSLTLDSRAQPDVPLDADAIEQRTEAMIDGLAMAMDGLDDAEADFRPAEGEWSIREVLAHLVASERYAHAVMQYRVTDQEAPGWPGGGAETPLQPVLARRSWKRLWSTLEEDLRTSADFARAAFDADAPPSLRRAFGESVAFTEMHVGDHIGQIQNNRTAAKETTGP